MYVLTKDLIESCLDSKGRLCQQRVKKNNLNIYSTKELYDVYYDVIPPLCTNPNCIHYGKELPFDSFKNGYKEYCNAKCAASSEELKNKIKISKETKILKYNELTKDLIESCIDSRGGLYMQKFKKYNLDYSLKELYDFYYDVIPPLCTNPNCIHYGKELPFDSFKNGYKEYCNKKCSDTSIKRKIKTKNTCNEKYGVSNVFQSEIIKDKIKQTCLEKYGCKYPMQSKIQQEKYKKTCLEKYGVENPSQNKEVQYKIKQTCLEKYGVQNPFHSKEVQDKYKETCLEKYGVNHYFKTEEFKDKAKQSYLEKYGVEHPTLSHITNYENFNEEFLLDNFVEANLFDVEKAMEYFNVSYNMFARTKCKFDLPPFKTNKGKTQQEIYNSIPNSLLNDRTFIKPLEIDILNHEFKFGLEYDGLMFHSFGKSKYSRFDNFEMEDKNYHLNKTKLVEDKEYQLFHIFENEWLDENKRKIWISMLNSKMNKTDRIYARKTEIREVSYSDSVQFLNNNHLQGSSNSNINLGLYYEDELVSLMTFGKARFSKRYEYELLRFCNVLNTTVIGGFSKLLRHFEKTYNPKSLISYANRRWSIGNVYEKNGFIFSHNSSPNYFYFKDSMLLESRNKYQKHKLQNLLENFNSEATESINMFNHGYRRIWDSGNKVYYKMY